MRDPILHSAPAPRSLPEVLERMGVDVASLSWRTCIDDQRLERVLAGTSALSVSEWARIDRAEIRLERARHAAKSAKAAAASRAEWRKVLQARARRAQGEQLEPAVLAQPEPTLERARSVSARVREAIRERAPEPAKCRG